MRLVMSALVGWIVVPSTSSAQSTSELEQLEVGLASDEPGARSDALAAYAALGADDVAAITARLRQLRRRRSDPLESTRVVTAFRHAVGSRRADDVVDVAPGVGITLAEARDPLTVRIGAAILLERAAERVASTDSLAAVVEIAAWDGDGMRLEARRIAMRVGERLAPVVIAARSHDDREARQWAEWAAARLGLDEPGRFVAGLGSELVPDVLRAFANAHVLGAVPVAISFVDSPRSSTRLAAREALTTYGQNAIWVARDAYRVRTGEQADLAWGWRRTLDALFTAIDARDEERVAADLGRATAALDAGDREGAGASLEAVLGPMPAPSGTAVGSAMLRLAQLDLDADDLAAARAHLRVAERLPLAQADEPRRAALRTFVGAEERLGAGILDTDAYARAHAADETCERCAELHARFEEREGAASAASPVRLWMAAAAFLVLALLLWPARRGAGPVALPSPPVDAIEASDGRDATLPG